MALPTKYKWLEKETGPIMIKKALELYDIMEKPGTANNPVIIAWAKEIGGKVENIYKADSIAWCGLFMAIVAKRAKKEAIIDPLWALNWGTFGTYTNTPMLGDVLVFVRTTSKGTKAGHVGLYVGEDSTCYHVLGGNQSDKVCITRIDKKRLYTARRPIYNVQPKNVRVIKLSSTGSVSKNEE